MISVLSCIAVEHDLSLVLLAGLLCGFGSWVTSRLYGHSRARPGARAMAWYLMTAVTAGVSIWSTHFVAMLGFRPAVPVSFDLGLTFVSLVIAVLGSAIGIVVAARRDLRFAPLIGGAILGLAISGMHYAGMIAYRVQGIIFWDEAYLVASILLAVTVSAWALHLGSQRHRWSDERMAGVLTVAIVSLHFTGMTAFNVAPLKLSGDYIDPEALKVLALAIAGTAGLVVLGALFSYAVETRTRMESIVELTEARNKAESASLAKSEFMSVLSHELRTPLTIVLGYADMLSSLKSSYLESAEDPALAEDPHVTELGNRAELYGQRVKTAGNHLLSLINDILDYTGLELHDLTLNRTTFGFRDMLAEAQAQLAAEAESHGNAITIDCDEIFVTADRARCLQIVLNLAGNAVKFSHSPEIILRAVQVENGLRFEVQDFGRGIAEEDLGKIFEAFQQLETADHRSRGGTGLGLAICRKLATAHGGDITVRSAEGAGATFTVTLPNCAAERPASRLARAA